MLYNNDKLIAAAFVKARCEWREVPEYPNYRVSDMGEVESNYVPGGHGSIGDWHPLVIQPTKYPSVVLCRNGKHRTRTVHTLVLETFVGPRPNGTEGCHNNGDPADCRLSNLRWDTPLANSADKHRHGTTGRGEQNSMAKITVADVHEIRKMLRDGDLSQAEIARRVGISPMAITRIKQGVAWSHVEKDEER